MLSAGDEADVLLCFYQHSYDGPHQFAEKGGIVLYDSDHVSRSRNGRDDYHHIGVPISGLTVEAIGGTAKDKGKNIYSLGLIAKMFRPRRAEAEAPDRASASPARTRAS